MSIKKISKILLSALVAVLLVASVLPASALKADEIPYGTPVVDGKMDDIWSGASSKVAIDMYFDGLSENYATGYARMIWDENNLYVLGYSYDKTKSTKVVDIAWNTDGFEVFLDERNAHNTVKNEISQIRVNRNGGLSGMLMSLAVDEAGILAEYKGTQWAAAEASDGYFIELAIPWTRIKGKAAKGTQIGIEFQINDDVDNDGTAETKTIINSEVIDKWSPITFRMMTLSSSKAQASTSNNTDSEKKPSGSTSTPSTNAPANNSSVESTVSDTSENIDSAETDSTVDNESTDNTSVDSTITDGASEEGLPKSIIIAIIAVAAVIVVAIIVCLALLLKPKKKKASKSVNKDADNQ